MTNENAAFLHFQAKFNIEKMTETFPFKPCRIADSGGDMSKIWYVEYYVWDQSAEKLKRKRFVLSQETAKKRYKKGAEVSKEINQMLAAGAVINKKKKNVSVINADTPIQDAIEQYLAFHHKTTKYRTYQTYESDLKHLSAFLVKHSVAELSISAFTSDHAIRFLDELITDLNLSTRRRNNLKGTMGAFFNFYKKRKVITENPFFGISNLPTVASKHHAYTAEKLAKMKELCTKKEPQLWLFINFIYYAFLRPGQELRLLRVRDIKENTILVEAENSKNNTTQHIKIPAALEVIIQEYKLRSYNEDWYVFGEGQPSAKLVSKNYFYRRHRALLQELDIEDGHDLYGWKHTGVIALFRATQNIELIRQQCRHSDIATTQKYLRDLGCFIDYDEINKFPSI